MKDFESAVARLPSPKKTKEINNQKTASVEGQKLAK